MEAKIFPKTWVIVRLELEDLTSAFNFDFIKAIS